MLGVNNAFLLASHIAFTAAFTSISTPHLPSTFSGAAPNLRCLPALRDLAALGRALDRVGNSPGALSGLAMEHSHMSRRQLCVWGAGIASVLVSTPARANENTRAAPGSIVPATQAAREEAEKMRVAAAAARTAALRVQAAGGPKRWTLMRELFLGYKP